MAYCVFCDEEKMKGDIVPTDNFFLKVGFCLIASGHTMIIPKVHYPCFGATPDFLDREYDELEKKLFDQISREFAEPFQLEYGVWGQSVNHAHTHFIPLKGKGYEIKDIIAEMQISEGINVEEVDANKLKDIYMKEGSYVSIKTRDKLYMCHTKGLPPKTAFQNPGLSYNAFFTLKKGVEVPSWQNMLEKHKIIDESNRIITKQKLLNLF